MGLSQAGFEVTGIDIGKQPHYPFEFLQADVLELDMDFIKGFDAIWASPPCQRFTAGAKQMGTSENHPDLVAPTRDLLEDSGLTYVIENVPAAPLRKDLMLCGSMFNLRLVRHRIFESNVPLTQPEHGKHHPEYITIYGNAGGSSKKQGSTHYGNTDTWREVMGIDWLPGSRLKEAIPPIYAYHIGKDLIKHI